MGSAGSSSWARLGSNQRPWCYEHPALTAELRARTVKFSAVPPRNIADETQSLCSLSRSL